MIKKAVALLGLTTLLVGCVTINIYFPEAAAERAADRVIRDIWGDQPEQREAPPAEPQSLAPHSRPLAGRVLDLFIAPAHANADINVSSPAIERLKASMRSRHSELEPHYASGAIGQTRDGLIAVRDANAIPLRDRQAVNRLVSEENSDRNALYREIAAVNGRPEWEANIRSTFARQWVENLRSGWYYQDNSGQWQQK